MEILEKKGLLVKVDENYLHNIATNYRGKGVIEPQVMKQWFVDVNKKVVSWKGKKRSLKEVMLDVVKSKMITTLPNRFEKIYFHWVNNLRDWCISRQIWWGHQIPVWYSKSHPEGIFSFKKPKGDGWTRDPDTLDTWFSSGLWSFATLGWPKKTADFEYFHPTSVLETGYDIQFFWVARMILASTYALRKNGLKEDKCIPFHTVYLHGLIRDRYGKKMSKSNPETCIDPLEMIEKYGTDAVRLSLIIGSSPGNDMSLYEEKIAGYRNFVNKIWNSARFALMNVEQKDLSKKFTGSDVKTISDKWILTELQKLIKDVDKDMAAYRFSDAGTKIYDFIWRKYCDWYLEISKGADKNPAVLLHVIKESLKLLHPFVPFVTETIWEFIEPKTMLMTQSWPTQNKKLMFEKESKEMELVHEVISQIRSIRAELKVEPAKKIHATIYAGKSAKILQSKHEAILRLARLETLEISATGKKIPNSKAFFVGKIEGYLPLKNMIDIEKEKVAITKQIADTEEQIDSIESKLNNQGFVKNAPKELVARERDRLLQLKDLLKKQKKTFAEL